MNEALQVPENALYGNPEIMRKNALQHDIPFRNIVIGCHFGDGIAYPGPEMYNIQIYATLAYGGRGIGYYTYYQYAWPWCGGQVCDTRAPVIDGRRRQLPRGRICCFRRNAVSDGCQSCPRRRCIVENRITLKTRLTNLPEF